MNHSFIRKLAAWLLLTLLTSCATISPGATTIVEVSPSPIQDYPRTSTATRVPALTPTPTETSLPSPTPGPGLEELLNEAQTFAANAHIGEAQSAYETLTELYPHSAEPWLGLAGLTARQGDTEASLDYLAMAIQAEPSSRRALEEYSVALEAAGRYKDLIPVLEMLIQLAPHNADLYIARATLEARLGDLEAALQDLEVAQSLDPFIQHAWVNTASAAYSNRLYEEAIIVTTGGLVHYPHASSLLTTRGLSYLSISHGTEAAADFDTVLALNPRNVQALIWRGRSQIEAGALEDGIADLQAAGEAGIVGGVTDVTLGYEAMADAAHAIARNDPGSAFNYLAGQVFLFGSRDPFLLGYARIDLQRGNVSLALSRLDGLVAADYIPALYWRAVAHNEDGNQDGAIADLEAFIEARSYGPDSEMARRLMDRLSK